MNTVCGAVVVAAFLSLTGCDQNSVGSKGQASLKTAGKPTAQNVTDPPPEKQSALSFGVTTKLDVLQVCGDGGIALNDEVALKEKAEVRTAPNTKAPKLRNNKASEATGRETFHVLDGSYTVRRVCAQPDWTQIRVVAPGWLTHIEGWVPSKSLRELERTSSGGRIYVESDFYWDKDTTPYKKQLVAVVNKIARENDRCREVDTGTVSKSYTRSKPKDPVFFVTCRYGQEVFNVWFRPKDAQVATSFKAVQPIGRQAAIDACELQAKLAAANPSTVNFSKIKDMSYMTFASGRARVVSSFTAKNAFNLELKYRIDCLFEGSTLLESNIAQAMR